jgi:hypothetical protein
MTPFRLFEYGAALAGDGFLLGLVALVVLSLYALLRAPRR